MLVRHHQGDGSPAADPGRLAWKGTEAQSAQCGRLGREETHRGDAPGSTTKGFLVLTAQVRPEPEPEPAWPSAAPAGEKIARPVPVVIRRRRVLGVLVAAATVSVLVAGSGGLTAMWWAAAACGALAAGYVLLVARIRHLHARRELTAAFGADDGFDWKEVERDLLATPADTDQAVG